MPGGEITLGRGGDTKVTSIITPRVITFFNIIFNIILNIIVIFLLLFLPSIRGSLREMINNNWLKCNMRKMTLHTACFHQLSKMSQSCQKCNFVSFVSCGPQWRSCAIIRAPTEFDSPLPSAGSIWGNSCIRRIFIAKMSITPKTWHFCCKMLSFQQLTHMLGFCRVKEQTNDDT